MRHHGRDGTVPARRRRRRSSSNTPPAVCASRLAWMATRSYSDSPSPRLASRDSTRPCRVWCRHGGTSWRFTVWACAFRTSRAVGGRCPVCSREVHQLPSTAVDTAWRHRSLRGTNSTSRAKWSMAIGGEGMSMTDAPPRSHGRGPVTRPSVLREDCPGRYDRRALPDDAHAPSPSGTTNRSLSVLGQAGASRSGLMRISGAHSRWPGPGPTGKESCRALLAETSGAGGGYSVLGTGPWRCSVAAAVDLPDTGWPPACRYPANGPPRRPGRFNGCARRRGRRADMSPTPVCDP